jgi:hypothetical protein
MALRRWTSAVVLAVAAVFACFACARSEQGGAEPTPSAASAASPGITSSGEEIRVEYEAVPIPTRMAPGSQVDVRLQVKNVGTKPWPSGGEFPLHFGYHWESSRGQGQWETLVWDDSNRGSLPADVQPGETVEVTLPVRAPAKPCAGCRVVIGPLLEMKAWSYGATHPVPIDVS